MASHRKYTPPPAPAPPEVTINGTAAAPDLAVSVELPDNAAQYEEQIPKHDEAALRLEQQLNALRQSEQLQRERQHMAAMQPSPEQVLQFWKTNGLDESGEQFLLTHPQHIVGLTDFASRQAIQQGHQPGSAAHTEAAKTIFHDSLERLLTPQAAVNPAPTPQPISRSSPSPSLPEPPPQTSHYSAPVSRGEVGNYHREPSPSQVRLSPEERQIAAISGISDLEYARNKLRLAREVQNNERQR